MTGFVRQASLVCFYIAIFFDRGGDYPLHTFVCYLYATAFQVDLWNLWIAEAVIYTRSMSAFARPTWLKSVLYDRHQYL